MSLKAGQPSDDPDPRSGQNHGCPRLARLASRNRVSFHHPGIREPSGSRMSSSELRDYATVVAATVALLVFMVNVVSQLRNRRIENIARFNQVHQRLFVEHGYIALKLAALDATVPQRERSDPQMERKFHLMLLEIERLAILANNRAVPRQTQVYMFGSYAPRILALMTAEERGSMFWELAVGYLERIAADSAQYARLTRTEREAFWR